MKTDNNKLLAKFLGYKPNTNGVYPIVCINEGKGWHLETMKFSYDWNWLVQVVDKIESLGYMVVIQGTLCNIATNKYFKGIIIKNLDTKIESVYNACVDFVKWYNEEKKSQ
jgi:hypothetical protein